MSGFNNTANRGNSRGGRSRGGRSSGGNGNHYNKTNRRIDDNELWGRSSNVSRTNSDNSEKLGNNLNRGISWDTKNKRNDNDDTWSRSNNYSRGKSDNSSSRGDFNNYNNNGISSRSKKLPSIQAKDLELDTIYVGKIEMINDYGMFVKFGIKDDNSNKIQSCIENGRLSDNIPEYYRRQLQIAFQNNTEIHVKVVKIVERVSQQKRAKTMIDLHLVPNRKLLVLEISNLLLIEKDQNNNDDRAVVYKKDKKPHCEGFLKYCMENFDIAVWTSNISSREQLDNDIKELFVKGKDSLVFIFDRFKNVVGNRVFKDCHIISNFLSGIVYSNDLIVMIDNKVECLEGNVVGRCIVVPGKTDDDNNANNNDEMLLQQGGQLESLLQMILNNESEKLKNHPMVPQDLTPAHMRDKVTFLSALLTSEVFRKGSNQHTLNQLIKKPQIPGPQSQPLRKKHIKDLVLVENRSITKGDYVLCDKSDGIRMILFADHQTGKTVFLDRAMHSYNISVKTNHNVFCPKDGYTIIDGELIEETENGKKRLIYLIFDVAFINGEDVGATIGVPSRIEKLKVILEGCSVIEDGFIFTDFLSDYQNLSIDFILKTFNTIDEIDQLASRIDISGDVWYYEESLEGNQSRKSRKTKCDGIVFSPNCCPYYYMWFVLKWKPLHLLTIDFEIKRSDLIPLINETPGYGRKDALQPNNPQLSTIYLKNEEIDKLIKDLDEKKESSAILECEFDKDIGMWRMQKRRTDKNIANSRLTSFNTVESIVDNLSLENMIALLQQNTVGK